MRRRRRGSRLMCDLLIMSTLDCSVMMSRCMGVPWDSENIVCSILYSTVQYSTIDYSTVQYSTVQYSTIDYSTVAIVKYDQLHNSIGFWLVIASRGQNFFQKTNLSTLEHSLTFWALFKGAVREIGKLGSNGPFLC
jgi:hypothetical protein